MIIDIGNQLFVFLRRPSLEGIIESSYTAASGREGGVTRRTASLSHRNSRHIDTFGFLRLQPDSGTGVPNASSERQQLKMDMDPFLSPAAASHHGVNLETPSFP
jgi:hypothetical protein